MSSSQSTSQIQPIIWKGAEIHAFLFDMDGVIADTQPAHREAWVRFLRAEQREMDLEIFMRRYFGIGNREIFADFYPDKADDIEFLDRKGNEKEEHFLDIFREGNVLPVTGLHEFLGHLRRRNIRIAAGSSAPRKNLITVLEGLGIIDTFEVIVSGTDVRRAKPDPEIFVKCRTELGVPAENCIVLEDSIFGLNAAIAAECHPIALSTTHPPHEIEHLAEAVVADYHELIRLLQLEG